ncbi:MAG: hypothetical protein U0T81_00450 [Saprospiraceae bacterium]
MLRVVGLFLQWCKCSTIVFYDLGVFPYAEGKALLKELNQKDYQFMAPSSRRDERADKIIQNLQGGKRCQDTSRPAWYGSD